MSEQQYRDARSAARSDPEQEVEAVNLLTNLGMRSTQLWHLRAAARYLADGLSYTAEREFDIYRHIMLAAQALNNVYLGDWRNVESLSLEVLARPESSVLSRIPALEALGRLRSRRGGTDAWCVLDSALEAAEPTQNLQLLGAVRAARAEAAWLNGDAQRAGAEARAAYELAVEKREPWIAGALLLWRTRAGDSVSIPDWIALPFKLEAQGDWRGAADEWQRLGCVYEQARALAEGYHAARLAALAIWDRLEARPAAAALRTRMRSSGVAGVPRGPRPVTRGNRYGLTARQTEILELLGQNMTNAEIAAQLHLSAKTVDHHVSAVLAKLDVHSRRDAGVLARTALAS